MFVLLITFGECRARVKQTGLTGELIGPGPYFGLKAPGLKPEIFAPGIVSAPDFGESNCLIWENGNQVMFFRIGVGKLEAINSGDHWQPLALSCTWGDSELLHCISPDGKTMYYNLFGGLAYGSKPRGIPIYCKRNRNNEWGEGMDTKIRGMWPAVDAAGNLYYTTGVKGFACIARVLNQGGKYSEAEILPFSNKENIEFMHPCIAADGSFIIMDAEKYPHENGCELYISFKGSDDSWTKPRNMGDCLPLKNAAMARLSADNRFIVFQAADDIYWVNAKIVDKFRPENMK
ncbi:MAG TPA: hypothetical protein VLQ89_05650 [Candidatus Binatia bacterium]|nr:hypothetical protein [Candidatus Binatia bacterium]